MKISFIIPYAKRSFEKDNSRLLLLINTLSCIPDTDLIIFDSTKNKCQHIPQKSNIIYIHSPLNRNIYSPAYARNKAVAFSKSDYLFFIDVDLVIPIELLKKLVSISNDLIKIDITAFKMFPCLYLTKSESKNYKAILNRTKKIDYLSSYMKGCNDIIESIALATSCLLVNREWFIQLNGFDETFIGHGGEDLELICRLALYAKKKKIPYDFTLDEKSTHPANYKGFRRYLAQYSLPHLFQYEFCIHLWHPRPLTHKYHRKRKDNERLLQVKLNILLIENTKKSELDSQDPLNTDMQYYHWLKSIQEANHWPHAIYPGLFNWKENTVIKRYFWRKCRKLLVKPQLFFSDFFKKHIRFPPIS